MSNPNFDTVGPSLTLPNACSGEDLYRLQHVELLDDQVLGGTHAVDRAGMGAIWGTPGHSW